MNCQVLFYYVAFLSHNEVTSAGSADINRRCGGQLRGPQGLFGSPTVSATTLEYPSSALCTWTISADEPNETVSLKFLDFKLEGSGSCAYDSVTVQDTGVNGRNATLAKYCGMDVPLSLRSKSNEMTVTFKSDGSTQYAGFSAEYVTAKTECGGNYNDTSISGRFGSPRDPTTKLYQPDELCKWTITARPGDTIALKFLQFQLEVSPNCNNDFLDIQDAGVTGTKGSLGKFCSSNTSTLPAVIKSKTNQLTFEFDTDGRVNYEGFILEYYTERNGVRVNSSNPEPATTAKSTEIQAIDLVTAQDITFVCLNSRLYKPTTELVDAFQGRNIHYRSDASRKCVMIGYYIHAYLVGRQTQSPPRFKRSIPEADLRIKAQCSGAGLVTVDDDVDAAIVDKGIHITLDTSGSVKCRVYMHYFIDMVMGW